MNVFQKLTRLVKRAVFTETGPKSVKRGPGEAKPLRPQASRLQKELTSRRLRHHYLTGQTCVAITLFLWLLVPLLPSSSQMFDMQALSLSLYIIALTTLVVGLWQARAMTRAVTHIEEI